MSMDRLEKDHKEHGLTRIPQVAGHRQVTACKAARHWSRSCGSAWISRYVIVQSQQRACSNNPQRDKNQKKNNINYHLSRMYPKIIGPHKRN